METPSADDARGGSPPAVLSSPAQVPPRRPRPRSPRKPTPPSALAEINRRLADLGELYKQVGLASWGTRKRVLQQLIEKLDHMHDDLVALREWARVPRPECYPEPLSTGEPRPRA